MKKILYAASECMPFAATGGLGDVTGSLPAAMQALSASKHSTETDSAQTMDIRVVLPLYQAVDETWRKQMTTAAIFQVQLGWRSQYCGVLQLERDGVTYYFIDNEYYFKRDRLYGHYDDGERFAFFSMAVLEMMEKLDFYPDILHVHDWQTALVPVYLKQKYQKKPGYQGIKSVFTIHNIEYQGKYDLSISKELFDLNCEDLPLVEWNGNINLMKGGIECADQVTTVSPAYAEEICTPIYGQGLQDILCLHRGKLRGILNGIDTEYYNPHTDPVLARRYSVKSIHGKKVNKAALQSQLGLPSSTAPLFAVISRLVAHKGTDLICQAARQLLEEHDAQLVVLGTGDPFYENFFRGLETEYPQKIRSLITYDRTLSKQIYAAADFFLMPSGTEPCGLSQMIACRYGAVPIVRQTGGLGDSIEPYQLCDGEIHGNGFVFAAYSAAALYERIDAALALYADGASMKALTKKIMDEDFSWSASGLAYLQLYDTLAAVEEPTVVEPTVAEPAVAEPTVAEPAVAEPTVAEPAVAEPAVAEPTVAEPAVAEPTVAEPTVAEPTVAEPTVAEPTGAEPTVAEPAVTELTVAEPTVAEPAVAEPAVADAADPKATVAKKAKSAKKKKKTAKKKKKH